MEKKNYLEDEQAFLDDMVGKRCLLFIECQFLKCLCECKFILLTHDCVVKEPI